MMPRVSRLVPAGLALAVTLSGCLTSTTSSNPSNRPGVSPGTSSAAGPTTAATTKHQTPAEAAQPVVGGKAPEITGKDQDDKEFKLSDYKGKVVLLDFWGNW